MVTRVSLPGCDIPLVVPDEYVVRESKDGVGIIRKSVLELCRARKEEES